jgi:EAL domain-containing protein (putative c-di-GMP-specific phosphodiesterase class I)
VSVLFRLRPAHRSVADQNVFHAIVLSVQQQAQKPQLSSAKPLTSSWHPPATTPANVVAFLQPVVSVRQQEVRLVEALARGVDSDGRIRSPAELFAEAARSDFSRELERACRRAAFAAYRALPVAQRPILSLNTDTALIFEGERGAERVADEAGEAGVHPGHVALEILEYALTDSVQLEGFCRRARKLGFLLALDDVGTGHSNLERIPRLEPDILKIDRVLVHGMSESYHRREVFRSLLALSHQIGALAIAEGVEDERDVMAALSLGCDFFQGFYFGRPRDVRGSNSQNLIDRASLQQVGQEFRSTAQRRLSERRAQQRRSEKAIRDLAAALRGVEPEASFDPFLHDALEQMPFVEALYVLDERGLQITDTIQRARVNPRGLFAPAPRGTDQSLKQYYLMLDAGLDRYTSDPYISSASGNFCITMSRYFRDASGQKYVLCCDLMMSHDLGR